MKNSLRLLLSLSTVAITAPALAASLGNLHNFLHNITLNSNNQAQITMAKTTPIATHYGIIIDAGSTGSRLHLFQYSKGAMPSIQDIFSESIKPGLSSFADHSEDAGASLKRLLDNVNVQLLNRQIDPRNVSITVLSTAGMRLLSSTRQQAINNNVTQYLLTNYAFAVQPAETISGKLEALYGWLDINYIEQHFQNNNATVGSIDIGGASVEIAFATHDTSKPDDEINVNINNRTYTVFAKSFLGLGLFPAFTAMNNDTNASTCYPTGYTDTHIAYGNFNYGSCNQFYQHFIEQNNVTSQLLPHPEQRFIAYSGTYLHYKFFNVDKTPDTTSVTTRFQNICSESWSQLYSEYGSDKYLFGICANTTYIMNLLYNTFQIDGSQLTVADQINHQEIDWTLGALLYKLTN